MFWGITLTLPQMAVAYAGGIALAQTISLACPFWLEIGATALGLIVFNCIYKKLQIALLQREKGWERIIRKINCWLLVLWFFLGAVHGAQARWPGVGSEKLDGQTVAGSGRIVQVKNRESGTWSGPRLELKVKLKSHGFSQIKQWQRQKYVQILLNFPKDYMREGLQPEEIIPGAEIAFAGQIRSIEKPRNPGAFDYAAYLGNQKIYCQIQVKSKEVTVTGEAGFFNRFIHSLRQDLLEQMCKYLPKEEAAVMTGCLLGNTELMNDEDLFYYRRAGIAHLFAVSGTHGSMVFAIAAFIIAFLPGRKIIWFRWFLSLCFLILYLALTGYPLSMLRTFIMGVILKTGEAAGRKGDSLTALAAAFIFLLWLNPGNLQQAGFQMSFGVVLGLLRLGPWLKKRIKPAWLQVSVAAQLAGMPFQAFWFHQLQPCSFVINIVEIALMVPLMVLGTGAVFISRLSGSLAGVIWQACGFISWWMHYLAVKWQSLPWACRAVAGRPWPFYLLWGMLLWLLPELKYYHLIIKRHMNEGRLKSWWKSRKVLAAFLILLFSVKAFFPQPLEAVFLDVGEGDCIVIHTPQGKTWLIDGGGTPFSDYDTGTKVVLPYLYYKGVNKIEGIFLSHHHQDHREGLSELLKYMPAKAIWLPPLTGETAEDKEFMAVISKAVKKINVVQTAQSQVQLERGLKAIIWWPYSWTEENSSWQENDRSLVIKLTYKDRFSWLFTGDIEIEGLKILLDKAGQHLNSTVLKLPHHGSSTSYLPEFYEAVSPAGAVATGGREKEGNVATAVKEWLQANNIPLWSTRLGGAVITRQKGEQIIAVGQALW